jgi:aspartate kinase
MEEKRASMEKTLVMKFGGTSVGTEAAMRQALEIICGERARWDRLVVVTSALSGVTDVLIRAALRAAHGDLETYQRAVQDMSVRHQSMIDAMTAGYAHQDKLKTEVDGLLVNFSSLCQAISVLGEASPRVLDAVAGLGERMSVRILAAAAEARGLKTQVVEATRIIVTDDHFQNALPDMEATAQRTRAELEPLLAKGILPVVTGFIGASPSGQTTTLGRGGSDFTASILGRALNVDEVWIWTDVNGVMTADPRLVPQARTLPVLSYREVSEMAHYGAKVLQPRSIFPVIEAGIPVRVCNTFNPAHPGTRLVGRPEDEPAGGTIKAMAALRGLQMVTVVGRGMLGVPGVAGRIFTAAATTGISVPLIVESTSEQSICFAVPKESVEDVLQALHRDLHQEFQRHDIDRAEASDDVDIITLVCPGLRLTPGVAGQIFSRLGTARVNVLAISYGASDISMNLAVNACDTRLAMETLHELTGEEGMVN